MQNHRLDVLYHPGGVLDLEKEQKPSKNPKNFFLDPPTIHDFSPLEPLEAVYCAKVRLESRLFLPEAEGPHELNSFRTQ